MLPQREEDFFATKRGIDGGVFAKRCRRDLVGVGGLFVNGSVKYLDMFVPVFIPACTRRDVGNAGDGGEALAMEFTVERWRDVKEIPIKEKTEPFYAV